MGANNCVMCFFSENNFWWGFEYIYFNKKFVFFLTSLMWDEATSPKALSNIT